MGMKLSPSQQGNDIDLGVFENRMMRIFIP